MVHDPSDVRRHMDHGLWTMDHLKEQLGEFLPNQLPQDVLQNPAIAVVLNFEWCVDSDACLKTSFFSIFCSHAYSHEHSRLKTVGYTLDVENLKACQAEARGTLSFFELQRKDAHADEITSVDTLEAFRQDRLYAQ